MLLYEWSRKMRYSKLIKNILRLLFVILFLIVFCIFVPRSGKITPSREKYVRIYNLEQWNILIKKYLEEKQELPETLYDLVSAKDFNSHHLLFIDDLGKEDADYEAMLKNRKKFIKYVDYELIIVSPNKWFIMEKRTGKLFQQQLVINQDNDILKMVKAR